MTERMDILTVREYESNGETKTAWTKIGVAFAQKSGDGWSLMFEALPIPSMDQNGRLVVKAMMRPPRDRDQSPQSSQSSQQAHSAAGYGAGKAPVGGGRGVAPNFDGQGDDDIPF